MWLNPAWSSAAAGCVRDNAAVGTRSGGTLLVMGLSDEVPVTFRGGVSVTSFDVRVFAIRRRPGRKVFEVRWRVAGRDRSRSFMTRALADSYRSELVRAARRGLAFDPANGEPAAWAASEPVTATWYQHAVAYSEMKWPRLAPHSRASLADALATVTPLLTRETGRRPPDRTLCAALYGHAFNPSRRSRDQSLRRHQPGCRRQPGAGPGDPGPGLARPAGTGRLLRLPVLRGAAPGGSRRPAPRRRHHSLLTFPQFRWYLKRYRPKPGDGRIRPTHSPRDKADDPMNRSL